MGIVACVFSFLLISVRINFSLSSPCTTTSAPHLLFLRCTQTQTHPHTYTSTQINQHTNKPIQTNQQRNRSVLGDRCLLEISACSMVLAGDRCAMVCSGCWDRCASAFGFQRLIYVAVEIGVWVSVFGVWFSAFGIW